MWDPPRVTACPPQELIYKEFFSQGDLVGAVGVELSIHLHCWGGTGEAVWH